MGGCPRFDPELYTEGIRPLLWFGVISSVMLLLLVIVNLVLLHKKEKKAISAHDDYSVHCKCIDWSRDMDLDRTN